MMNTKPTRGTIIGIGMLVALWIIGATVAYFKAGSVLEERRASKSELPINWDLKTNWVVSNNIFYAHDYVPSNPVLLQNAGTNIFSIARNGKVTIAEGVPMDEAARAFWDAVAHMAGHRCTNDGQWPAPLNVPQGNGVPVEQQ